MSVSLYSDVPIEDFLYSRGIDSAEALNKVTISIESQKDLDLLLSSINRQFYNEGLLQDRSVLNDILTALGTIIAHSICFTGIELISLS